MANKKALPAARKTNGGAPAASAHYAQMQEAAQRFDRLLAAVQELPEDILAEASSQAELELALEDVGWLRFGIDQGGAVSAELRRRIIERSRAYWQFDPVARHVIRLWTVYSVGTGLSYKARDPKTQDWLDEFFHDTRNRRVLSPQGQQKSSRRCLIDGVLPLGLFRFEDDGLVVRRFDPLQITEILSDPDDEERVLFYKREFIDARGQQKVQYLRDWLEADSEDIPEVLDPLTKKPVNGLVKDDEETPLVYYINFEDFLQQGTPLLQPVLDWLRELRKFLESRVAFAQALMRYAWKLRAKGGQDKLTELRAKLQSSLAQGFASGETNPPAAAGSTWLESMATELVGLPRETGAAGARNDADLFKLQVSSGTGIFLHYLGDPSTGNLATATAMELPMLKIFEAYQQLWTSVYSDLCEIAQVVRGAKKPQPVDIDWPPIVRADLPGIADATSKLLTAVPGLAQPEVMQVVLLALGINNVDDVVKRVLGPTPSIASAEALTRALQETKRAFEDVLSERGS